MKPLLVAWAVALCAAGCRDQDTHTKIIRCADGLEVAVFYDKNCSFPPPAKVEFRKDGKVVTLSWEEEYPLEEVVSPDQKWIFLQEANNGRFKFCPENQIMQCLEDDSKFVHIIEASGAGDLAGFIFDSWEAPHTALISFAAGGETEDWKVDLEEKVITRRHPKGEPMFKPVFLEDKGGRTAEAMSWFLRAAEMGHAGSQARVGTAYATGTGLPEDPAEARRWWRKAAAQGNAEGQHGLALAQLSGSVVPQDKEAGVKLLQLAAAQDFAPAQLRLAECYLHGDGVAEAPAEAVRWYRRAAENGHAEAQAALGFICQRGLWGVPQDPAQAAQWFQKAAAQNHAQAQYQLGLCQANGTGVPKDLVEALKWCALASASGNADAASWVSTHEKELTSAQQAEARARVQAFHSRQSEK